MEEVEIISIEDNDRRLLEVRNNHPSSPKLFDTVKSLRDKLKDQLFSEPNYRLSPQSNEDDQEYKEGRLFKNTTQDKYALYGDNSGSLSQVKQGFTGGVIKASHNIKNALQSISPSSLADYSSIELEDEALLHTGSRNNEVKEHVMEPILLNPSFKITACIGGQVIFFLSSLISSDVVFIAKLIGSI